MHDISLQLHISEGTIDELVMAYSTTLTRLVNTHAALVKKTITLRPHASWFADELRQAKRKRRQCGRKWIHPQLDLSTSYCLKLVGAITTAKY